MDILFNIFSKVWENTEKSDAKVHARQVKPEGITEENNFPYIDDKNPYHLLDVYYPENTEEKLPVIIDIHGGGWMYADKDLNKFYCLNLAKRGFCVFNISYPLVPDVRVRDQLKDISKALKWIGDNIDSFPADKNNIMLTGDSAGGQLAVYSAVINESAFLKQHFSTVDTGLKFTALTLTSPVAYMNTSVMGAYCRKMWDEKPFRVTTTPYLNLDEIIDLATLPPTLFVTSSGDFLALKQTKKAYELFLSKGIDASLLNFPKFEGKHLPHVFGVLEPESKAGKIYIDRMCEFFRGTIK